MKIIHKAYKLERRRNQNDITFFLTSKKFALMKKKLQPNAKNNQINTKPKLS